MRDATINLDYYQVPTEQMPQVEMPQFLLEWVDDAEGFIQLKREFAEIFTTYFHSDQFKETINNELSLMLFNELNRMFDNVYLAQIECKRIVLENKVNHFNDTLHDRVKEEISLVNRLEELRNPKNDTI